MNDNTPIDPVVRDDLNNMYGDIENVFDLAEDDIALFELENIVSNIDVTKSSCVVGIMTAMCKDAMSRLPDRILYLFSRSIDSGIFPSDWSKGTITFIPKDGKLRIDNSW